jgi:tetratricopeptide (TPR) repeat protein
MKKILLPIIITLSLAEPSAFEAGNLDSDTPYGLTKDEKYIWQNKQDIKKLKKIIALQNKTIQSQQKSINQLKLNLLNYKMKIDNLNQRLSGVETLLTVVDSLAVDIHNLKTNVKQIMVEKNDTKANIDSLQKEIQQLKDIVNKNKENSDQNIQMLINLIEQLAKKVDTLNVKKEEINFNKPKSKLLDEAISYYRKLEFVKAKKIFEYLYKKQYKPALELFYLGEIEYKRGYYKNALAYYKKSIKISSKPSYYMDDLLYHTGYSFEKLGNKKAAILSYQKLIKDFPKSVLVKYAKSRLKNLQKTE